MGVAARIERVASLMEACTTRYDEERHIYYFVYHESTRQAVDDFIRHMEKMDENLGSTPEDRIVHVVIDVQECGLPPIGYLSNLVRRQQKNRKNRRHSRVILMYNDNTMLTLLGNAIALMSQRGYDEVRFFPASDYDTALEWLCADTIPYHMT